ncbi:MAG: PadR family transcriptional regulator [Candidatus Izemoplasmatales bacterium]
MDIQLKKGLLDLMVLASIKYEDSYGYKIIQDMSQIIDISESTLYPILKRLEKQKLVNTYNTTHNSRIRKYYQINPSGLEKLKQSIDDFDEIKKMYMYIKR